MPIVFPSSRAPYRRLAEEVLRRLQTALPRVADNKGWTATRHSRAAISPLTGFGISKPTLVAPIPSSPSPKSRGLRAPAASAPPAGRRSRLGGSWKAVRGVADRGRGALSRQAQRRRLPCLDGDDLALDPAHDLQRLVPPPLKFAGHQTICRIHSIILPACM